MEIHTPKKGHGKYGKGKRHYFIDNDDREFATEEELIAALKGGGER